MTNSSDEKAPLTQEHKEDHKASTPLSVGGKEDHPDYDPELTEYGGKFTKKIAFLQVTIRLPLDLNPLNLIALLYGFLPFIVPGTFAVHWLATRHLIPLFGLSLSLLASLLNEVLFKPFCNDPRPKESANKYKGPDGKWHMKHGMPSGHCVNSLTILVWATLEVALRGPGLEDHLDLTLKWLFVILVLMAPVPWARWYNSDHSLNQCLVGSAIGIVFGIVAFYVRITYFADRWKPWDFDMDEVPIMLSTTVGPALRGSHAKPAP